MARRCFSLVYSHHLELTAFLAVGSAFSFLQMASWEHLPPSSDDRWLLQSVLLLYIGKRVPGSTSSVTGFLNLHAVTIWDIAYFGGLSCAL